MRKRMIDPSIWTNRHFLRMDNMQKLLFISLISHADDEGKLWYDAISIKAFTFPADDIAVSVIEDSLKRFSDLNLIWLDDKSIELKGWLQYQSVPKPQKSQIPAPKRNYLTTTEPLPNQLGSVTEPIPKQYSTDTEPIPPKERKKERNKEINKERATPSGEKTKEQKQSGINGNSFEADTMLNDVAVLFEEHKFKLSHPQFNEVKSLIDKEKHLSAQIKLFEYLNLVET